ncbi:hypothetical protein [Pseudoneobacillus rhizosphaerae]|nr:hypothetical protein [Pseudoneobacillus rhizosphaerae]
MRIFVQLLSDKFVKIVDSRLSSYNTIILYYMEEERTLNARKSHFLLPVE